MGNFYTDVIKKSSKYDSIEGVRDLTLLEPVTRQKVINIINKANLNKTPIIVTETFRSINRQKYLFQKGATKLQNVGVHHYGLAADFVFIVNGEPNWNVDYSPLWKWCAEEELISGHDWGLPLLKHSFTDPDHVQRITLADQTRLFNGSWYPDDNYSPIH